MEEILASIRRIIADDEAKPPAAAEKPAAPPPAAAKTPEKPAAPPPAAKPAMADIPPSKIPAAVAAAAKVAAPPPPPPPAPAPAPAAAPAAAKNNQDDIDALLAGLDETTTPEEVRPPQPDGDVFELTDEMVAPTPPPAPPAPPPPAPKAPEPAFQKVEPEDDLEFAESAATRVIHQPPTYAPSTASAPPTGPHQAILSQSTVSAVESAFNTLANTVLSNNARTLEDLVKEMLRPMLKSWLDDNLPGLVERIVKAEIERVSRGR
jgi:cell pole-organizing protein PopZ